MSARSSTDRASVFGTEGWGFEPLRARERKDDRAVADRPEEPEAAGERLRELQAQIQRLLREQHEVERQIAELQALLSRSRGRDRRRALLSRSASLPALQMRQRSLAAEIFRLEQEFRALRQTLEQNQ